MGMTLTQKILAAHAGLESVNPGQLIRAKLDIVLGNDITTPVAINEFTHTGVVAEVKRNPRKISLSKLDHKVAALPKESFGNYHFTLQAFSLEDM